MALVPKTLAAGKLGTSSATLYEVPSPQVAARVTQVVYSNTGTNNTATHLLVQPASLGTTSSYNIIGAGTLVLSGGSVETPSNGQAIMLSQGDKLEGYAETANVIDFFVCGGEEA